MRLLLSVLLLAPALQQEPARLLHADFRAEIPGARVPAGVRRAPGGLEFASADPVVELDPPRGLDGLRALSVGGWFFPRRAGEQAFFSRGVVETAPGGERLFRPRDDWVNFVLGTDPRGFLLGTINGNGTMPFPHVTIEEVPAGEWSQLVVVKRADGFQEFYRNGALVHSDRDSAHAPGARPFREKAAGDPIRVSMPLGGLVGEAWIVAGEMSAAAVLRDYEAKRERYAPALPPKPAKIREMNARAEAGLWAEPLTAERWPRERERILRGVEKIFGRPPAEKVPLDPKVLSEEDCGRYVRRKVSIQVHPGDRMPAYLLIPKGLKGRAPAILCFYGTTSGAGKETTVGLSGPNPGTPPAKNRAFAVDLAEAGFVAFAADYLRDGERVSPGRRPYDTTEFYERFPDWSIHGKDAWDNSRAIDYLETLDFVDASRIGMLGHSYGGHSTIFAAAFEPRIRAAVANGPVSDFIHHGMHWAVPKGAGASQSLPAMRPYILDRSRPPPLTFYEVTALIAPRPLLVGQAAGERRPREEENCAAVGEVYRALGAAERARYVWYAGDHDLPPEMRDAAIEWFRRWLR